MYVGSSPTHAYGAEPSLINPQLPATRKASSDPTGNWPSYAQITPGQRATYLQWLSSGKQNPEVDIGYVFLYLYGLERRVYIDVANDANLRHELVGIHAEVNRLLTIYGDSNPSFRNYATDLQNAVRALSLDDKNAPPLVLPPLSGSKWPVPMDLRIAIGSFARNQAPVPPEWVLRWAWYHPEVRLRTPALRCPEELARLFSIRLAERFPEGFMTRPGRAKLRLGHHAANNSIRSVSISVGGIPNTFELKGPVRKLDPILQASTSELDSYSRWIGRNPHSKNTISAAALLPSPLIDTSLSAAQRLEAWAKHALVSGSPMRVSAEDLIAMWSGDATEKLTRPQSSLLLDFAHHLGYGIEPDVRFGGPALNAKSTLVLFRLPESSPQTATPAYQTAMTVIHLAAAVSAADGDISHHEVDQMGHHAESHLQLTPAEQTRLFAHLLWLSTTDIKLTGLRRRISELSSESRHSIGDILISVSTSDGTVSPDEISTVTKIFRLLEIDHTTVPGRIHAALAGAKTRSVDAPVTVQPASPGEPGVAIPAGADSPALSLDRAAIDRIHADTAIVSSLLHDIFVEEEDTHPESSGSTSGQDENQPSGDEALKRDHMLFEGLDPAHSRLLETLATKPEWSWQEFSERASELQVMPDGAIDTINEAALDITGEPVIEGDDPVSVQLDLIEEMTI